MTGSLGSLLHPESVAIVGATDDRNRMTGASLHNLLASGYAGRVYPVNPSRTVVQGVPCWPSLDALPEVPETIVIVTPARHVVPIVEQAAALGVSSATVVSSGFGEGAAGAVGQERHAQLTRIVADSGIRLLGPNTAGLMNPSRGYYPRAAFNQVDAAQVTVGGVALVTQSGAISNIVFNRAQAHGVGFHSVVATGDQVDLSVWEVARHLVTDETVTCLALVIESLGNLSELAALGRAAAARAVPVVVLPLGRTDLGRNTVMGHTGAAATSPRITDAVLRGHGFAVASDFDTLWGQCCVHDTLEWAGSPRLGVFCFSGGDAALIADSTAGHENLLPPVTDRFREYVAREMSFAVAANPFDATGEVFAKRELIPPLLRAFKELNGYDHVLVSSPVFRPELADLVYPDVLSFAAANRGAVLLSAWSAGDLTAHGMRLLRSSTAPAFESSRLAIGSYLRAAATVTGPDEADPVRTATLNPLQPGSHPAPEEPGAALVEKVSPAAAGGATYEEARQILRDAGMPVADGVLATDPVAAVAAATRLGMPVVVKADVDSLTHKAVAGLVRVGVEDVDAVRSAYEGLASAAEGRVVVEAMVRGEPDVLLGASWNPAAEMVIAVGSGGALADYLDDIAIATAPMTTEAAQAAWRATGVGRYLRERQPERYAALIELTVTFAAWAASARPEVAEMNPVRAAAEGWCCLDARVALASPAERRDQP